MRETWARARCLAAAIGMGAALASSPASAQEAETIRIAGAYPAEHPAMRAMARFKERAEITTRGRLQVEVVSAEGNGDVARLVERLRAGEMTMAVVGVGSFAEWAPELEALTVPFLFTNRVTAFNVVDGPVVELIDVWLRRRNFHVLGYMDPGASRPITPAAPIRSVADLEGLEIGLVADGRRAAALEAVGARPVAVDGLEEAYAALQRGTLEALHAPSTALLARAPAPAEGHISDLDPVLDFVVVVANRALYGDLALEHKEIVARAMQEAVVWQRAAAAAAEQTALETLTDRGMRYEPLPAELRAELWKAVTGVVEEIRERAGAEFVDAVIAEARGPTGAERPPLRR